VLTNANTSGTNGLTCLPKHGGARDNKFSDTYPITDQRYLTFAITFLRGLALKLQFGVTQFKEILVLQLTRFRIQTALLLSRLASLLKVSNVTNDSTT
jgi:hypothetical protein